MVCGHNMDLGSMAYCFWGTVTLISGLSFREKIVKNGLSSVVKTHSNARPITRWGIYHSTKTYLVL